MIQESNISYSIFWKVSLLKFNSLEKVFMQHADEEAEAWEKAEREKEEARRKKSGEE